MIYTITLNPAIDRLIFLTEELTKRKTNRSVKVQYDIGGKGTHASYAMSQLGADNLAVGFAGEENFEKLEQVLEEKEIRHQFIKVAGGPTRESVILIDPKNEGSTMITEPGFTVSRVHKKALLYFVEENVRRWDHVLVAGSLPLGFSLEDLQELLKAIKETGCFLACDLADEALQTAIELGADFIKPNEFELRSLLSENQTVEALLEELSASIACIVASKGAKGSVCYHGGQQFHVTAPLVREVNDTGAGDCFVGSFLAVFSKTGDAAEALRMAAGCAASKVKYEDSSYFDVAEAVELAKQTRIEKKKMKECNESSFAG